MACELFTTTISDNEYSYTQMVATKSLKMKYKILGLVGSGSAELMAHYKGSEEEQMEAFGKAMQKIFSENDPEEIVNLIKSILSPAFRNGERINIDNDFTGGTMEMYKVLIWILKKEYGDFFEEAGHLFQ